jgi:hypothetical protein
MKRGAREGGNRECLFFHHQNETALPDAAPSFALSSAKTCLFSSLHLGSTTRIIIVISGIHGEATGKHDHLSKDGNKKKKMRAPPTVKK